MDRNGETRVDRINREAEAERRPGDPRPVEPRNVAPLIVMVCAAVVIAIGVVGMMYFNKTTAPSSNAPPSVAEQPK